MIKAILFDYNGVIADDLEAVARTNCAVIHALGGREVSPDEWFAHISQDWTVFFRACGVDEADLPRAMSMNPGFYANYDAYVLPMSHAREVLVELKRRRIMMGILSGANREIVLSGLRKFDLEQYFSFILGCEDLVHQKPHPEGLQKSLVRFGLAPEELLYVDDMPSIFAAAKRLGIKTVGFASRISGDLAGADVHIRDLRELLCLL